MAISQGSLQSLNVLRDITRQQTLSNEAEKKRGAEIAQTRIQADERRIDRMNMRLERLQSERMQNEKSFTELTGLQAKIEKKQADTGIRGTDGPAFIQSVKLNAIDQQEMLQEQITGAQDSISQLNNRLSGYYKAYNVTAPDEYEDFRDLGGGNTLRDKAYVTGNELDELMKKVSVDLGREVTPVERAGMVRKLDEMGKETFNELVSQEKLRLMGAQLAATSKGADKDAVQKYFVDRWGQHGQSIKGVAERLGINSEFTGTFPKVLTSVQDISKTTDKTLDEIGRMAVAGKDMTQNSDKLSALIERYEEYSVSEGDNPQRARDIAAEIGRYLQTPGAMKELDFSNWPTSEGDDYKEYFRTVLETVPIIEEYMDSKEGFGTSDPLFRERSLRAMKDMALDYPELYPNIASEEKAKAQRKSKKLTTKEKAAAAAAAKDKGLARIIADWVVPKAESIWDEFTKEPKKSNPKSKEGWLP